MESDSRTGAGRYMAALMAEREKGEEVSELDKTILSF